MTQRHALRLLLLLWLTCASGLHAQMQIRTAASDTVTAAKDVPLMVADSVPAMAADSVPVMVADSMLVSDSLSIDTTALYAITDRIIREKQKHLGRDLTKFKPDPIRSLWLGLVIPGAGQFYNRKYWKLPVVYGGFLGCVYALTWNNQMLEDYSQAYLDIMDTDPNTKSYEKMLPAGYDIRGKEARFQAIFQHKKDYFRKYRDLSIFAFGAVYLLSVIDAYVDAELSTFDISRDLSFRLQPTMLETSRTDMRHRTATPGIQCVVNF